MSPLSNLGFRISNRFRTWVCKPDTDRIPVIINNRNRITMLRELISRLERAGIKNIHIIDNNSDYPPLLKYYKEIPYPVYMLDKNVGCYSLWKSHIFQRFNKGHYVYTDSDVVPVEDCPKNFLQELKKILDEHPEVDKVGLSLKIDDLPDKNEMKEKVLNWEKQYWEKPLSSLLYDAPVDTTFALYRSGKKGGWWIKSLRTGYPYIARHLPWYLNSSALPDEEKYYIEHASIDSSWYKNPKKNK